VPSGSTLLPNGISHVTGSFDLTTVVPLFLRNIILVNQYAILLLSAIPEMWPEWRSFAVALLWNGTVSY